MYNYGNNNNNFKTIKPLMCASESLPRSFHQYSEDTPHPVRTTALDCKTAILGTAAILRNKLHLSFIYVWYKFLRDES